MNTYHISHPSMRTIAIVEAENARDAIEEGVYKLGVPVENTVVKIIKGTEPEAATDAMDD